MLTSYHELVIDKLFLNLPQYQQSQLEIVNLFTRFITENPRCCLRENIQGHVTGSALVINSDFSKVLLTYHAKLKKWLQLGGHADGNHVVHEVAMQEAVEESGITKLSFVDLLKFPSVLENKETIVPFDLDVHFIPKRASEAGHFHYDFRYLLRAEEEDYTVSAESLDLKWIPIVEVGQYTNESSTLRQIEKLKNLISAR